MLRGPGDAASLAPIRCWRWAVSRLAVVFKLDKTGFNLRRGVAVAVVGLIPLIVLSAIHQEKYFVSMIFAVLLLGGSDPGGEFGYRMSHMAVFAVSGALLTALGFGVGGDAWGWVVLAVFAVTLVAGLAVKYGLHRFVSALLLNIWFAVALSVQAGYRLDHTHTSWWAQALAWLIGSALVFAYVSVMWLARGRTAQQRLRAGNELAHRERLHEIVVCARIEAENTVLHRIACREDQNGYAVPGRPQFSQQV